MVGPAPGRARLYDWRVARGGRLRLLIALSEAVRQRLTAYAKVLASEGLLMRSSEILFDQGEALRPRRLTPRECARLMGFPDAFRIPVSDTQAYRQFGNSVVMPVMREVARIMPVSSTRSSFTCSSIGISVISSRNSVPPFARSK